MTWALSCPCVGAQKVSPGVPTLAVAETDTVDLADAARLIDTDALPCPSVVTLVDVADEPPKVAPRIRIATETPEIPRSDPGAVTVTRSFAVPLKLVPPPASPTLRIGRPVIPATWFMTTRSPRIAAFVPALATGYGTPHATLS
jgi:hypothetical protein